MIYLIENHIFHHRLKCRIETIWLNHWKLVYSVLCQSDIMILREQYQIQLGVMGVITINVVAGCLNNIPLNSLIFF